MTLAQMRYIIAVDRFRHFGKGAEHCHVSQPTLSMGIQKAEEEIGAEIFDRTRKPVQPTDIGVRIIQQARIIVQERDRMDDIVAELSGEVTGDLTIGVIPTLATYLLPMITQSFAETYPNVNLSIHEMTTGQILQEIDADRIDAGVLATTDTHPGMINRPLYREEFVAFVSPNHRLAPIQIIPTSDLDLDDLWLLTEGHCFRQQVLDVCSQHNRDCGPHRAVRFESGNLETLRHMIETNGGMTLLPWMATLYLNPDQKERYIHQLTQPAPYRIVSMLYGRALLKHRLIDAYVETILANVPEELERVSEVG